MGCDMSETIIANGEWHSEYKKKKKNRSIESLNYVISDCRKAIKAMPDNPKSGQYSDEIHYCHMELRRRRHVTSGK